MTILLLFLVVVVSVVIVFGYFLGFLRPAASPGGSVTLSGSFLAANGGGNAGVLTFVLKNAGNLSVTGVTFGCPSSQFVETDCGGLFLTYNGGKVTPTNPVPGSGVATGTGAVHAAIGNPFTPGTIYTVTYTVTLSDGSSSTALIQLAAQA